MNFSPFNASASSGSNLSPMYLKNPYSFMPVDTLHSMGYQTGKPSFFSLEQFQTLKNLVLMKFPFLKTSDSVNIFSLLIWLKM